ncbi:MAG: hypothetical protein LBU32_07310 [Clostridiales bacterium]|nr:hypothetical protein [Clostridiales bacterium]
MIKPNEDLASSCEASGGSGERDPDFQAIAAELNKEASKARLPNSPTKRPVRSWACLPPLRPA